MEAEAARYRGQGQSVAAFKNQSVAEEMFGGRTFCCLYSNVNASAPWDDSCEERRNSLDAAAATLHLLHPSAPDAPRALAATPWWRSGALAPLAASCGLGCPAQNERNEQAYVRHAGQRNDGRTPKDVKQSCRPPVSRR